MAPPKLIEFIPDRLYYASVTSPPQDDPETHYFSTDATLVYLPFEQDFGPLNLGQAYAFFAQLSAKLKDKNLKQKRIVYYSGTAYNYRANSITLIAMFMVCVLNRAPEDVQQIVQTIQPPLTPFRDACMGPCPYGVTVLDVMNAAQRAMKTQLFSLNSFKYDDYYFYSQVENGDLTWILPNKIVAFAGPVSQTHPFFKYHPFTPQSYIPLYQSRNVTAVVRLNEACYNKQDFVKAGIRHYDLPYPDGSIPPDRIVRQFLQIVDQESGAVAVHCKAGLGRTGTLIGLYMMKKYQFTAREVIAWLRVLRPGSVLGQQQQYMCQMEAQMRQEGKRSEMNVESFSAVQNLSQEQTQNHQPIHQPVQETRQVQQPLQQYIQEQKPQYMEQKPETRSVLQQYSNQVNYQKTQTINSPSRVAQTQAQSTRFPIVQQMYKTNQSPTLGPIYKPAITQPHQQLQSATFNQKVTQFNNSPSRPQISSIQRASSKMTSYSPMVKTAQSSRTSTQNMYSPQKKEETVAYGFGANGRVHPDVVKSPISQLKSQVAGGLPGIRSGIKGRGQISDM
ncbi:Dual_specificity protein phosphatase CDC14A [Hexamita inflata]|uniref:protein-tyrosine-phosphatase n=1 Tax=Hexamita inflata TaxID=28002 RepID=A0AA86URH3_9EUKA|nr:Dual specificity protein phosphatase CDC14A [Hexamita inflata]